MKNSNVRDAQKRMLEILKEIDRNLHCGVNIYWCIYWYFIKVY